MLDLPSRGGGPGSQRRSSKGDDGGGGGGSTAAVMGISFATELGEEMWIEVDYPAKAEVLASWWWSPSRTGLRRGRSHGSRRRRSRHASQLGEDSNDERRGVGEPGKRSRPHVSWICSPWKTQGSGLLFHVSWASKGLTDCPREACPRGFLAPGIDGEPGGEMGFQTSPKIQTGPKFQALASFRSFCLGKSHAFHSI